MSLFSLSAPLAHYNFIYFYKPIATQAHYDVGMSNAAYFTIIAATFAGTLIASHFDPALLTSQQSETAGAKCVIKGNISFNGGKRIYHVPGQHYYDETVISASKGERWFCSEDEARAAGWRKAGY